MGFRLKLFTPFAFAITFHDHVALVGFLDAAGRLCGFLIGGEGLPIEGRF